MSTEKIDAYLSELPADRKGVMEKLMAVMKKNLLQLWDDWFLCSAQHLSQGIPL
jgi:hypothetical protein